MARKICLRTSGISANHFLNPGSVPYTLAVSKNRTPWLKARRSSRSMNPATLSVPALRMVTSTPVLPNILLGTACAWPWSSSAVLAPV